MKYTIHRDWHYTSNGCSCCEPSKWEIYYILDEYGDKLCVQDGIFGDTEISFQSEQEALHYLLELQGIKIEYTEEEDNEY